MNDLILFRIASRSFDSAFEWIGHMLFTAANKTECLSSSATHYEELSEAGGRLVNYQSYPIHRSPTMSKPELSVQEHTELCTYFQEPMMFSTAYYAAVLLIFSYSLDAAGFKTT